MDNFRCSERAQHILPNRDKQLPHHANLVAGSSHGHFFTAISYDILAFTYVSLRGSAQYDHEEHHTLDPVVTLSLASHLSAPIAQLALLLDDAVLAVVSHASAPPLFLSVPHLLKGLVAHAPTPLAPNATRLAVAPSLSNRQLVAILSAANVAVHEVQTHTVTHLIDIDTPDARSIALSPHDKLLAIGTPRGSVSLHNPTSGALLGTIAAVESGWLPFSLHFLGDHALFVSYIRDGNLSNIIWELSHENESISVHSRWPLGELCFTFTDGPPDGVEHPVINVVFLSDWDIAIVASSLASDLELVTRANRQWSITKLDEGKTPTMPFTDDDEDTMPVGIALDFNDMRETLLSDPSNPKGNPMPYLHVFTSANAIIPFQVIDERPGSSCASMRPAVEIPSAPTIVDAPSSAPLPSSEPASASQAESQPEPQFQPEPKPEPELEPEPQPVLASAFNSPLVTEQETLPPVHRASPVATVTSSRPVAQFSPAQQPPSVMPPFNAFTVTTAKPSELFGAFSASSTSTPIASDLHGSAFASQNVAPPSQTMAQSTWTSSGTQDGSQAWGGMFAQASTESRNIHSPTVVNSPFKSGSTPSAQPFASPNIQSTTNFFQQTSYPQQASPAFQRETPTMPPVQNAPSDPFRKPNAGVVAMPSSMKRPPIQPPVPRRPTVEIPSRLNEAVAMTRTSSSSNSVEALRSILLEMSAELTVTREAHNALVRELKSVQEPIVSSVNSTRKKLETLLQETKNYYLSENKLRDNVTEIMQNILASKREVENIQLEHTVRQGKGAARELSAEDRSTDELMAKQEGEIVKSLRSIESRLTKEMDLAPGKPAQDIVQRIYSSLSLQGLRIKRLLSTLTALNDRVIEQDKGGRHSNFGLSLARLEKLSLHSEASPSDAPDVFTMKDLKKSLKEDDQWEKEQLPWDREGSNGNGEGSQLLSTDVREVIRRLAMQGGRKNITVGSGQEKVVPRSSRSRLGVSGRTTIVTSSAPAAEHSLPRQPAPKRELNPLNVSESSIPEWKTNLPSPPSNPSQAPPDKLAPSFGLSKPQSPSARDSLSMSHVLPPSSGSKNDASIPPNVSSHGKSGQGKPGFFAAMTTDVVKSTTRPIEFASLPLDNAVQTASSITTSNSLFAALPPEDNNKVVASSKNSAQFAALPPDDTPTSTVTRKDPSGGTSLSTTSASADLTKEQLSNDTSKTFAAGLFATLPPSDDTKPAQVTKPASGAQFAALPPDDNVRQDSKPSKSAESGSGSGLFASLPPDGSEKDKPSISFSSGNPPFAALPPAEHSTSSNSKPKTDPAANAQKPSVGLFGVRTDDEQKSKPASISAAKSQESTAGSSGFAALASGSGTGYATTETGFGGMSTGFSNASSASTFLTTGFTTTTTSATSSFSAPTTSTSGAFGFGGMSAVFGTAQTGHASMFGEAASQSKTEEAMRGNTEAATTAEGTTSDDSDDDGRDGFAQHMDGASSSAGFESGSAFGVAQSGFGQSSSGTFGTGGFGAFGTASSGGFETSTGFGSTSSFGGSGGTGFGNTTGGFGSSSVAGFGNTNTGFGSSSGDGFGAISGTAFGGNSTSSFGSASPAFATSSVGFSATSGAFGATPAFSGNSGFGGFRDVAGGTLSAATKQGFGSSGPTFGASSALGGAAAFGAASPLGGGGGAAAFGSSSGIGFGTPAGQMGGGSPFGAVAGVASGTGTPGFGGGGTPGSGFSSAASGSGFAALASSGGGGLVGAFGNGAAPAFTSAAFSERRF